MAYRAAVIGCGLIGSAFASDESRIGVFTHAGAYRACARTELVALADSDPAKIAAARLQWGLPAADCFLDVHTMLAQRQPHIVSIATPDSSHYAVTRAVLECPSVRAILAEKPLALDPAEAEQLVQLAAARGVLLAVNYSRRFDANHRAVADAIRSGQLGRIQAVSGAYTKGVTHNASHWFDLVRYYFGEVAEVAAWPSGASAYQDDPTPNVHLRFASGLQAHLLGLDANAFSLFELDIIGSAGRVRIVDGGHRLEWYQAGASPFYAGYQTLLPTKQDSGGMRDLLLAAVENVAASLAGEAELACTGQDGVAALRIAHAACRALASGQLERPHD